MYNKALFSQLKTVLKIFLWPVYWISGFFPRNPRIWVCGSWNGERFADNSRWFFLHCLREHTDKVRVVWVTRDRALAKQLQAENIPAYYAFGLNGLWYTLSAGIYIFDAYIAGINFWTSRNARKVNLFHGIPLKKIERDITNKNHDLYKQFHGSPLQKFFLNLTRPSFNIKYDLITCTSQALRKLYARAFFTPEDRVAVTGYPRNDILHQGKIVLTDREKDLFGQIERLKRGGKRLIFYLPTFRDTGVEEGLPFNWEELDRFLVPANILFFIKLHGSDKSKTPEFRKFRNIREIPHDVDPYPFLLLTDALVTDYSSIFFDFLLLGRPIVFYAYDLKKYLERDRAMYFPYEQVTPGEKTYDFEGFLIKLRELVQRYDSETVSWEGDRERILKFCHTYRDPNSSERVFQAIYERFCVKRNGSEGMQ